MTAITTDNRKLQYGRPKNRQSLENLQNNLWFPYMATDVRWRTEIKTCGYYRRSSWIFYHQSVTLFSDIYTVFKKLSPLMFDNNFSKCGPILLRQSV